MEITPPNLFFLTFSDSEDDPRLKNLKDSIQNDILVIPYDKKLGNMTKIIRAKEYVENATQILDTDIVVLVDGFDVICINYNKEALIRDFLLTGKNIIFSGDKLFCNAKQDLRKKYDLEYSKFTNRYLNSGFQIGFKNVWLKMMNTITQNIGILYNTNSRNSDQMIMSDFFINNISSIEYKLDLDVMAKFCHTFSCSQEEDDLTRIDSYFIHVYLVNTPRQKLRYEKAVNYFLRKNPTA